MCKLLEGCDSKIRVIFANSKAKESFRKFFKYLLWVSVRDIVDYFEKLLNRLYYLPKKR